MQHCCIDTIVCMPRMGYVQEGVWSQKWQFHNFYFYSVLWIISFIINQTELVLMIARLLYWPCSSLLVDVGHYSGVVWRNTVNAFQCASQPMFDASMNNWVSGSVRVTGVPLRTLYVVFHQWRSSSTVRERGIHKLLVKTSKSRFWEIQCWASRMCIHPRGTSLTVDAKRPSRICHVWAHPPWPSRNERISALILWYIDPELEWPGRKQGWTGILQKGIYVLGWVPTYCREWVGPSCGRDCLWATGCEMVNRWASRPGANRYICPSCVPLWSLS